MSYIKTKESEEIQMIKIMNEELLNSKKQLVKTYLESIETLRLAVEAKDYYTVGHSERVSEYAVLIGKKLKLPKNDLKTLKIGGLFHDIGKIGIPDYILLKPEKLSSEEFEIIKKHPLIGSHILSGFSLFNDIIPIIKYHHEKFDGTGYPDCLTGTEIPFLVRIISVADSFDAMTSKRSYRKELDLEIVKKEILSNINIQFDPQIAFAFLDILTHNYNYILEIKNRY